MKINSPNGHSYWLHSVRAKNRRLVYFFSKKEEQSIPAPPGYVVMFNKNGLPYLKKLKSEEI